MNYYALIAGTAIAVFIIVRFRRTRLEKKPAPYPVLLATFPAYYWVFALYASDYNALMYELAVGAVFIALTYVAYKLESASGAAFAASAYIGHAIYDAVHDYYFTNAGTPTWWPEICGAVDGIVGVYLIYLAFTLWTERSTGLSAA